MLPIETIALKYKMLEITDIDMADLEPDRIDFDRAKGIQNKGRWNMDRAAHNMANKITDICKCIRRARAVNEVCGEAIGDIFFNRAKTLLKNGNYKVGGLHDRRG